MKLDYTKHKDTLLGYCIINASTKKDKDIKNIWPNLDAKNLEVQFIVNGVELPIIQTFEDIQKQIDGLVNKKALDIVEEKLSDVSDLADIIVDELKRISAEKLGIELED